MKFDPERRGRLHSLDREADAHASELARARREWERMQSNRKAPTIASMSSVTGSEEASARMTRRGMFLGGTAAAVTLMGMVATQPRGQERVLEESVDELQESQPEVEQVIETRETVNGRLMMNFEFPQLRENERLAGNIYAYYLGVDDGAPIPLAVTVDGRKVLVKFYDEKEDFIRRSRRFSEREKEQYLRNCQQARTHALAQFDARENFEVFPSIAAFVERIDAISNRVHSALDWAEIERRMGLSSEELELVRNLSGKVDGKMLLAYALTELFPAQTGLSIKIFEQYIKNGGVHILELIPAIYDRYISHGLAQFTSFALKDTGTEIVGASVINRALPEAEQIPRSVLYTDTYQEQFKGMHLFGVYNMARLVKRLNRNERALLRNNLEAPVLGIALTQFLASAHHAPAHGYTAMQRFIRAGMRGSHKEHARERVQPYIQEAHDYYRELEDILARRG